MNPPTENYLSADVVEHLMRLSWETLDYLSSMLGRPTEGHIAWAIWYKSNQEPYAHTAAEAMRRMGYAPFNGYPLVLAGPRAPEAEAIHQALEAAYDEIRRGQSTDAGPNPILISNGAKEQLEMAR